jgi:hypothetical protein
MTTQSPENNAVQTALRQQLPPDQGRQTPAGDDPRRPRILAKTIYRELRASGLEEREVLAIATAMLALVAADIRESS